MRISYALVPGMDTECNVYFKANYYAERCAAYEAAVDSRKRSRTADDSWGDSADQRQCECLV